MRNKVARKLRKLAGWHPEEGKWIKTEAPKIPLQLDSGATFSATNEKQNHFTKNPAYAAYQQLKEKYKQRGTALQ